MLELTMATVSGAEAATGGMMMADAPSEAGAVLRVGRDKSVCRIVVPGDWVFVSPVHLEFACGAEGSWDLTWVGGPEAGADSEVRLVVGESAEPLLRGGTVALPKGGHGEVVISDRSAPRSVNMGFYHEF
ncbi:FHA domain-containing protein [Nocardia miyunensis]|uniref:FHA domain-containing protein n=1 Tax=Nocardia miyunensis TaxID=282684 RepID=UPI00082FC1E3|nr:FHA domain-containing protein [Nocardia miyunensis]